MICLFALFLLSAVLFGVQLGKAGLLDPDEPFYSLTAKEMLESGDPWTPRMFGQPQFEKPILFYWVLYASFRTLGISEFSARLGPCAAGILTVLLVYFWGRVLFKRHGPAFVSAAMLASAGQFIVLSRVVLTDIFLCLFVTAAFCAFSYGYRFERARTFAWHLLFVFCALGFLTKGPLGFLIPFSGIAAYSLARERWILKKIPWVGGLALFSLIGLPWYALMTQTHGTDFLRHFFIHENVRRFFVAEHRSMDRWYFYPFVLWFGFFPWGAFVAAGLERVLRRPNKSLFLALSFLVPFAFFMLARSKLMSYIFPLCPVIALITGSWVWKFHRAMRVGVSPSRAFLFSVFFGWGFVPLALSVGAWLYAEKSELPILAPIAAISAALVPLSWLSLYLLCRKKILHSFAVTLVMMTVFSSLAFGWMMPKAGLAFSSKRWARDYERLAGEHPDALFMTSKQFVRGMTFYTGAKDMGVFSTHPKGGFYTPHPIRIVSDTGDFLREKKERFPVYFLIRGKEFGHLLNGLAPDFSVSVVKAASQRILVRLDRV